MVHRVAERRSVSLNELADEKSKMLYNATRVFVDFICKTLAG
jgi:hypothetical protein